mmetsp:Transcript_66447/g.128562  ORF Transcript_66447/g.128562 Transcript_66447/m.128562 type:complete len:261 (-) Transcript_66447:717-1499(-)
MESQRVPARVHALSLCRPETYQAAMPARQRRCRIAWQLSQQLWPLYCSNNSSAQRRPQQKGTSLSKRQSNSKSSSSRSSSSSNNLCQRNQYSCNPSTSLLRSLISTPLSIPSRRRRSKTSHSSSNSSNSSNISNRNGPHMLLGDNRHPCRRCLCSNLRCRSIPHNSCIARMQEMQPLPRPHHAACGKSWRPLAHRWRTAGAATASGPQCRATASRPQCRATQLRQAWGHQGQCSMSCSHRLRALREAALLVSMHWTQVVV